MKFLSLLTWVGQFGFSILFPLCFFLMLGVWLQEKLALGLWVILFCGLIGLLTSFSTAKSCLKAILKEVERFGSKQQPPTAFNDHV